MEETILPSAVASGDEEKVLEYHIPGEELSQLPHPHILVEENRVILKTRPDMTWVAILAAASCIPVVFCLATGALPVSLQSCALLIAATLFFCACVARFFVTVTFDGFEKTVERRNPFYRMAEIPLSEIAEVSPFTDEGKVFFKFTLKSNRYGKGVRITQKYGDGDGEYLYFLFKAFPAIAVMLEECKDPEWERALSSLADNPVHYVRDGSRYVFTTWKGQILTMAFGGFMLTGFTQVEEWVRWVGPIIGCFSIVGFFLINHTIVIDTEKKTIEALGIFGLIKRTVPLNRYTGFRVVREHINGLYAYTTVYLDFVDPHDVIDLHWSVGTKKLSALVDETNAIITSAMAGGDDKNPPER